MPYKIDKIRLTGLQDRRKKLNDEQKEAIRERYAVGDIGQRSLAKEYGVSRSLIQIIVNPNREMKVKQHVKEHWRDYYDKKAHAEAIRKTRRYKQGLYLKGELKVD